MEHIREVIKRLLEQAEKARAEQEAEGEARPAVVIESAPSARLRTGAARAVLAGAGEKLKTN